MAKLTKKPVSGAKYTYQKIVKSKGKNIKGMTKRLNKKPGMRY